MYRIAICDSDRSACRQTEQWIRSYAQEHHKIVYTSAFLLGSDLLSQIDEKKSFDAVILDIALRNGSGINIGRQIRRMIDSYDLPLIYTASSKYDGLKLFRLRPFDFLAKPLQERELAAVLDELFLKLEQWKFFFSFHTGATHYRIPYQDILYFASCDKKVSVVTTDRTVEFWGKLREVKEQTGDYFLSIHKSFLINTSYVRRYGTSEIEMADGRRLNISQSRRKEVRLELTRRMDH